MTKLGMKVTTFGDWPVGEEEYELRKNLGKGATSTVYSAYCISRNKECAIKRIFLDNSDCKINALKEIGAMMSCNHTNIAQLCASFDLKIEYWLRMSSSKCSLFSIMINRMRTVDCSQGVFDEVSIATVLKSILKGLECLHYNRIVHRDIKTENILVNKHGTIQIADFGLCMRLSENGEDYLQKVSDRLVGTYGWMAPEVIENNCGYNFKADIWSFGISAIEMVAGNATYEDFSQSRIVILTLNHDPPTLEDASFRKRKYTRYGNSIRKTIADCLQKDPEKRSTVSEILNQPFFEKAKDENYVQEMLLKPFLETGDFGKFIYERNSSSLFGDEDWMENPEERRVVMKAFAKYY